jgi:general secretion pathway protein E
MWTNGQRIGEILVELGYAQPEDIQQALKTQRSENGNKRIGEILVEQFLSEEHLVEALSVQLGLPMLEEEQIPQAMPIEKVSFEFLKKNNILPLSVEGSTLNVAVADPLKTETVDSLRATFDYNIKLYLAGPSFIQKHIEELQASKDAVMQRLLEGVGDEESQTSETLGEVSHLKDLAQEKGIIQLANIILENAVKEQASDIHIEPEESDVRVRYRIDGILYEREILPVKTQAALSSRLKLLSRMNIAERRLPQDGRIKGRFAGREVDIRVSTLPTVYGESIVMRLLDKEASLITLEDLGYDEIFLDKYQEIIRRPFGMILMTGPTGSGKTTTLYASLDRINSSDKKIITIEEPVEYLLKGINQIQVRPKIGLTFAGGLRHIVRQDPDVIMVGEIRDLETASIAVHASLTGHLLFSTLHTNDAPSAVTRLIEMGVEHYLVSSTLIGIVAQRLVRKICKECKEPIPVPEELRHEIGADVQNIWRGAGCDACMHTGYRGRIAIFELLVVDDNISNLIGSRVSVREIRDAARKAGMRTLREDGMIKVRKGITTVDEVLRVTQAELS